MDVYSPSSVAYSHNGLFLAAGPLDYVLVMDSFTGHVNGTLDVDQHLSSWRSIAFGLDDKTLYVGGQHSRLTVWDWPTKALLRSEQLPDPYDCSIVSLSPNGRLLATAGFSRKIALWSIPEWNLHAELDMDSTFTTDCAFDPTGRYLAACGSYRSIYLWDMSTRERKWVKSGLQFGSAVSVSFSNNGLLTTNLTPFNLAIIDVETGDVLDEWETHSDSEILDIQFSQDGSIIAASSHLNVKLWHVPTRLALPR